MSYSMRLRALASKRHAPWLIGAILLVVIGLVSGIIIMASGDKTGPSTSTAARLVSGSAASQAASQEPEGSHANADDPTAVPSAISKVASAALKPLEIGDRSPSARSDNAAFPKGFPSVACDVMNNFEPKVLLRGQTFQMSCTVTSKFGFSAPSALTCGEMMVGRPPQADMWVEPGPLPCSFSPATVTPPAGGSVRSTLTIQVPPNVELTYYDYAFRVYSDEADSHAFPNQYPLNLLVDRPHFTADCGTRTLSFVEGGSANLVCRISVPPGFGDGIEILLGGIRPLPTGHVSVTTDVSEVTLGSQGGAANFVVTATSDNMAAGSYTIPLQMRSFSGHSHRSMAFELLLEIAE